LKEIVHIGYDYLRRRKMIEVILVHTEYDEKKPINKDGLLPINKVTEVEKEDYPDCTQLGIWNNEKTLKFKPHLEAKIGRYYERVNIAIRVTTEEKNNIERIYSKPDTKIQNIMPDYQEWSNADITYYVPPILWESNKQMKSVSNHYTGIGKEKIIISYKNSVQEYMFLESIPSKTDMEIYNKLLEDLIRIDISLATDNESNISMSFDKTKKLFSDIEYHTDKLQKVIRKIEKTAEHDLIQEYQKMPVKKVKHLTGRVLLEHMVYKRKQVNAISYRETSNIYEHRVLKKHIIDLEILLNYLKKIEQTDSEREKKEIYISSNCNLSWSKDNEEKYKEYETKYKQEVAEAKEYFLKFKKSVSQPKFKTRIPYSDNVTFKITDEINFSFDKEKMFYTIKQNDFDRPIVIGIDDIYEVDGIKYRANGRGIEVGVDTNNILDATFFNIHFNKENKESLKNASVTIYGKIKNVKPKNIKGRGPACIKVNISKGKEYASNLFVFEYINKIKFEILGKENIYFFTDFIVNKEDIISFEDTIKNCIFSDIDNEKFKILKSQKQKIERLADVNSDKQKLTQSWKRVKEKLNSLKGSKIFRDVVIKNETLKKTNLFSWNRDYANAYKLIKSYNKILERVSLYGKNSFSVGKLSQLYEYWCCIKILSVFIQDFSFEFKGGLNLDNKSSWDNLRQFISDTMKQGVFSNIEFKLYSPYLKIEIKLLYNCEIKLDNKYLVSKGYLPYNNLNKQHLIPDIVLKIKRDKGNEKIFCIDAKYRTSKESSKQNPLSDWYKDICEVALQKYIIEVGNGNKEYKKIEASYIIHSDNKLKSKNLPYNESFLYKGNYLLCNPQCYYGARPELIVNEYRKIYHNNKNNLENFTNKAIEWAKFKREVDNNETRLGSIMVLPDNDVYLKNLIRLIMEHYFEVYREICWMCGSKNLEIEKKKTKSNYDKWHITCDNCKEFWVQTHCSNRKCPSHNYNKSIVKHSFNFYDQNDYGNKSSWNVHCPFCHDLASGNYNDV